MSKPTVRRLTDLSKDEKAARNIYRSQLNKIEMTADLADCRKPVWISCFFDGTGNNFKEDGNGKLNSDVEKYSNVAKLAKFAHPDEDAAKRTYGLYAPGVGTPFPAVGDSGKGIDQAAGMASAAKGQARITWMLQQFKTRVERHMPHVSQINVAVFGFSRGAAQARAFVRQLADQCYKQGEELIWTKGSGFKQPRLVIYFLGIFDTVASVGFGGSRMESSLKYVLGPVWGGVLYSIDDGGHADWASDLRIPWYVRFCEHYVASHEVREKFPSDSVREDQNINSNCRETFYPGAHSDVGGGYGSMTQEGRSNELSRIALCNMYLSAYAAGVPLNPPSEVLENSGSLFEITSELQSCFEAYMSVVAEGSKLEQQVISHMAGYYHWRWGRTERQRAALKERQALIAKGQSVMYATPDTYMTTTDQEWETDVQDIAEKKTGFFRSSTTPLEDVIFDAWKGKLRKSMKAEKRALFDKFFDRYVHDSVAGFKNQMADSHLGSVEASRWSRNRQYFMGKRGKKFLYWRYEGDHPETEGAKEAMLMPKKGQLPTDGTAIA
ncbi:T6SS phospholipase effector Tle1-like catalytic domain-containing protein [Rugamonas rivuli]|uniref:DUF2235 domain-containing protein n=1 Tax=Rugamonas rivuli TaxID=2743358 RepID=A0A843S7G7_9BURK|nr:DUF2235 domain-containing protein [Rugamonas rivuli]MQA18163.1 DUF2235 domain-containing protein [Rugamonas rivuli]